MSKVDLSVQVGGIRMKNPVMTASGTFGYGPEYAELFDLDRLGAVVVKGISPDPVMGNPPPRTVEVTGGLLNAIGLQNPGVEAFVKEYLPFWREYDVPLIVNIWGRTVEEYARVAERLDGVEGVAGLEINVSCPNIKEGSCLFGSELDMFCRVVETVRKATHLPIIPKLAPDVSRIVSFARAAEDCGADALSLINSIPAMAIDISTRRPRLGNVTGGMSGPAIKPIALKMVWEVARAVKVPVVGMGGISCAEDAIEFIVAGATAVAIGTANFTQPDIALSVIDGIEKYAVQQGVARVTDLIGSLKI